MASIVVNTLGKLALAVRGAAILATTFGTTRQVLDACTLNYCDRERANSTQRGGHSQ